MRRMASVALCVAALVVAVGGCGGGASSTNSGRQASGAFAAAGKAKFNKIEEPLIEAVAAYQGAAGEYGPKSPHTIDALHKAVSAGSKAASSCRQDPGCPISSIAAIDRHLAKIGRLEARLN